MRRARFWIRTAATAIDGCIAIFPAAVIANVLGNLLKRTSPGPQFGISIADILLCDLVLMYTAFDVITAGTLGKKILGLRIADADGTPAGRWRLLLRWATKTSGPHILLLAGFIPHPMFREIGSMMNGLVMLGCLAVLNDDKRSWHDEWAQTAVFHKSRHVNAA